MICFSPGEGDRFAKSLTNGRIACKCNVCAYGEGTRAKTWRDLDRCFPPVLTSQNKAAFEKYKACAADLIFISVHYM